MCRVLGYLGRPATLEGVLYEADSALVRQAYGPQMMAQFLNLAGFGMAAWDPRSEDPEEPFIYRVTELPAFDRNLRHLACKLRSTCTVAHVRGVTWRHDEVISPLNLHPFRFGDARLVLAHNGHLREFAAMRYDLLPHIRPDLAQRICSTTDSEWIYALVLSCLDDPFGNPAADEVADATRRALRVLRDVRKLRGIETSSPVNLFMATGECLVVTRFSFDYGWYPPDDLLLETDLPYVSLWYTLGDDYTEREGEWLMVGGSERPQSMIIASEPLTRDISTWLEVPEYSMVAASRDGDGLRIETSDLDV